MTKTNESWTEEQWNEWGIFFNLDSEIERANLIRRKLLTEKDKEREEAVMVQQERFLSDLIRIAEIIQSRLYELSLEEQDGQTISRPLNMYEIETIIDRYLSELDQLNKCNHEYGDVALLSNPLQYRCIKCGELSFTNLTNNLCHQE